MSTLPNIDGDSVCLPLGLDFGLPAPTPPPVYVDVKKEGTVTQKEMIKKKQYTYSARAYQEATGVEDASGNKN